MLLTALLTISVACAHTKHSIKVESCLRVLEPALEKCGDDVEAKCKVLAEQGTQCLTEAKPEHLIELMHSLDDGVCMKYKLIDLHLAKREGAANGDSTGSTMNLTEDEEHRQDLDLVHKFRQIAKIHGKKSNASSNGSIFGSSGPASTSAASRGSASMDSSPFYQSVPRLDSLLWLFL